MSSLKLPGVVRVAGVLGGDDLPISELALWLRNADLVIAADGGADRVLAAGAVPHHLVGDLDSASSAALRSSPHVIADKDPSRTDCDKMIAFAERLGVIRMTVFGLDGDLLDHMLASLYSLAASNITIRLVLRQQIGAFVKPHQPVEAATRNGDRVAMMPLGGEVTGVTLTGVEWPLHSDKLHPYGLVSVANRAVSSTVNAQVDNGVALLLWQLDSSAEDRWRLLGEGPEVDLA